MIFATIVGARPQFVKASALGTELRRRHREILVHTGQHYDYALSGRFFDDLGLPPPDHSLGIGSGPQGAQTGAMLAAIEAVLVRERPDAVIVYADTNSTLAGALAAAKLDLPIAHVEAGLRSFNRRMPEEVNRILTDHVSRWLFAPSEHAASLLAKEGITRGVHVVGDVMADALAMHRERAASRTASLDEAGVTPGRYALATVHRAENVEDPGRLRGIFEGLERLDLPVVVPLHPRTRARLGELGIVPRGRVRLLEPQGFLETITLETNARCILTDSGGMQKEAYYLRVPCVTLRDETEWVETVETGWNRLAGADPDAILAAAGALPDPAHPHPPLYGDGHAAQRIVDVLTASLEGGR